MSISYASIYTTDGDELTTGLQVSAKCDEAIQAAKRLADSRREDVELIDDDGRWLVHPAAEDGTRESADFLGEVETDEEATSSGSWVITDDRGRQIEVSDLPDGAVAYDESGFEVDLDDINESAEKLADGGYGDRASRRILVWASEEESRDDDGARAIASARWVA